jgi:hypothetical protein
MNDWAGALRAFRFGYVRGAVIVIFILTMLIWILEVTEDDNPFGPVSGRHAGSRRQRAHPRQAAQKACDPDFTVTLFHDDGASADVPVTGE